MLETPFKPKVTEIGQRHPVTANLPQAGDPGKDPDWGRWFRLVTSRTERGNAVLSGADERPLVILDRVGEGRVAQLMSDHLWLWNRGIDGGGPQPELVRRTAHWLMKEPDLEEEALRATSVGGRIEVTRRTLAATFPQVTMTAPDGSTKTIDLRQTSPGLGLGVIDVDKPGLYRFDDGTLRTVAAVGNPDPLEFSDVRATDAKLKPLTEASGGSIMWLADTSRSRHPLGPPRPRRRRLRLDRAAPQRGLHGRRHQPAPAAARHPGGDGLPAGPRQRLVARGPLGLRRLPDRRRSQSRPSRS